MSRTGTAAIVAAMSLGLTGCGIPMPVGGTDHDPPVLSSSQVEALLVAEWVRDLNDATPTPGATAVPTAAADEWTAQCGDWDGRSAATIEDLPCELTPTAAGEPVQVLVTVQSIDGWQGFRVSYTRQ